MLQEGLILLGAAMVLHARRPGSSQQRSTAEDAPDSDPPPPPPAYRMPEPTLDPAVTDVFGGGQTSEGGNAFQPPGSGFGRPPAGLDPAQGDAWHVPGATSAGQLSAANRAYNTILGNAYTGIKREVANVRGLVNFQRRVLRKIFHF